MSAVSARRPALHRLLLAFAVIGSLASPVSGEASQFRPVAPGIAHTTLRSSAEKGSPSPHWTLTSYGRCLEPRDGIGKLLRLPGSQDYRLPRRLRAGDAGQDDALTQRSFSDSMGRTSKILLGSSPPALILAAL